MTRAAASDQAQTPTGTVSSPASLPASLRQMVAALERERQALATLDADGLFEAARDKEALCEALSPYAPEAIDHETRPLVETARRLNDVNRRVRNLLAANVAARLEALGAPRAAYKAGSYARTASLGMNP
ncbi:MAG: flagellar protein FlgN [Erythrobacter sp.]|uniref:flagellar protein FlgN n=1 Tax=Erythrobacter sp. TaxID=1042 RepID=UPI0026391107|nr:flagellar protein FlgN [Erythrobacter sp.]MDJ0979165.1 flagellar protein FlgN [Erythrobacter sp.]